MIDNFDSFEKRLDDVHQKGMYVNEAEDYHNSSGRPFWGDVGAGVLPIAKDTGRVLVGLRSEYVNEPGTYGGFGGKIDDQHEKNNPKLAAMRELHEEAGDEADIVSVVPAAIFRSKGFVYHNFICVVAHEFEPDLDFETESAKWVTLEELMGLDNKHFGLDYLLDNSMELIKKYAR